MAKARTKKERLITKYFNEKCLELGVDDVELFINNGEITFEDSSEQENVQRVAAYNFELRTLLVERFAIWLYSMDSLYDMVLHEIAHILVGHSAGHGNAFKKKCKEIGCKGMYTHNKYDIKLTV